MVLKGREDMATKKANKGTKSLKKGKKLEATKTLTHTFHADHGRK
jgi:hypothetical protein